MKTAALSTFIGLPASAQAQCLSQAGGLTPLGVLPDIHMAHGGMAASYSFNQAQLTPAGEVRTGVLAAVATDMALLFAEVGALPGADLEVLSINLEFVKAPAAGGLYVAPSSAAINWTREGAQLVTMQGRDSRGDLCFKATLLVDITPARTNRWDRDPEA